MWMSRENGVQEPVQDFHQAPCRPIRFGDVGLTTERREDGTLILSARAPLVAHDSNLLRRFWSHGETRAETTWVADRDGEGWRRLSYGQARRDVSALAIWLKALGIAADRSILILSGNSPPHAVWMFGAMAAGVPICSVSTNYSLLSMDHERLRHVVDLVKPAVIFAETGDYARAATAVAPADAVIVSAEPQAFPQGAIALFSVLANPDVEAIGQVVQTLDPTVPARYLLTSGSTGRPKAVIHTQAMMTANTASGYQAMGDAFDWGGVMLDWLPWSHIAGSSLLTSITALGGTLHIDDGRPTSAQFAATLKNLREIPVRFYGTMPSGYAMLADALEADPDLRRSFFSELRAMLFGGAGLPQPLHDRLQKLAVATTGQRFMFVSGYGSTETGSAISYTWWESTRVGIGLPTPGTSFKLVPADGAWEVRVKAPSVTPGYLGDPDRTQAAFDEEGFLRMDDLVDFHDPARPELGLVFAGRRVEQFKLANGTFVAAGRLRNDLLDALPGLFRDVVICGEGQAALKVLAWPDPEGVRRLTGEPVTSPATHPSVRAAVVEGLRRYNATHTGQSERLSGLLFLDTPPDVEAHEVSDKGSINRNTVLRRRVADVEKLYAGDDAVITP